MSDFLPIDDDTFEAIASAHTTRAVFPHVPALNVGEAVDAYTAVADALSNRYGGLVTVEGWRDNRHNLTKRHKTAWRSCETSLRRAFAAAVSTDDVEVPLSAFAVTIGTHRVTGAPVVRVKRTA